MFINSIKGRRSVELALGALLLFACDPTQFVPMGTDTGGAAGSTADSTHAGTVAPSTAPAGGSTSATGGSSSSIPPIAGGTGGNTWSTDTLTLGGSTGTGGATTGDGDPFCGATGEGVMIAKNVACTAADKQTCYKPCGPQSIGTKQLTCTTGVYVETPACSYIVDADYSCYQIPETLSPFCPATSPRTGSPCAVPECTPCNLVGGYLDSAGAAKTGYCICATKTDGTNVWSCATSAVWPCPGNQGC